MVERAMIVGSSWAAFLFSARIHHRLPLNNGLGCSNDDWQIETGARNSSSAIQLEFLDPQERVTDGFRYWKLEHVACFEAHYSEVVLNGAHSTTSSTKAARHFTISAFRAVRSNLIR